MTEFTYCDSAVRNIRPNRFVWLDTGGLSALRIHTLTSLTIMHTQLKARSYVPIGGHWRHYGGTMGAGLLRMVFLLAHRLCRFATGLLPFGLAGSRTPAQCVIFVVSGCTPRYDYENAHMLASHRRAMLLIGSGSFTPALKLGTPLPFHLLKGLISPNILKDIKIPQSSPSPIQNIILSHALDHGFRAVSVIRTLSPTFLALRVYIYPVGTKLVVRNCLYILTSSL